MNIYGITDAEGQTLSRNEIDDMLKGMGISEEAIKTGTDDAIEEDAKKQGITNLDFQLTDMVNQKGINGSSDTAKPDYEKQLSTMGIPSDVVAKGQEAIQAYATQFGIILPQANGTFLNMKF